MLVCLSCLKARLDIFYIELIIHSSFLYFRSGNVIGFYNLLTVSTKENHEGLPSTESELWIYLLTLLSSEERGKMLRNFFLFRIGIFERFFFLDNFYYIHFLKICKFTICF